MIAAARSRAWLSPPPSDIDRGATDEHRSTVWPIYEWKAKIRVEMTPGDPLISYLLIFLSDIWHHRLPQPVSLYFS